MPITNRVVELIKRFEGLRLKAYRCPAGYLTIGYGHILEDKPENWGLVISEEDAERLLWSDLKIFERGVLKRLRVKVDDWMLDALVSFTFNVGLGNFERSTLRLKVNRGDFLEAGDEFLKWVRAGGVVLRGLILRREAERELYLEGVNKLVNNI